VVEDLVRRSHKRRQPDLQPGDEPLPGIVVESALPGGSQARTFLARHVPSGKAVVVKQLVVPQVDARRRLWKELDAQRGLSHPSIPRLLDFTLDPAICVAYEHVPGRTLQEALRRGPLGEAKVRGMAHDLLAALHAVHAAGFVHGDVKPSNIVLGSSGRAHLIDFGLVEARALPRATLDGDGNGRLQPSGTLDYMAPELARTGPPGAPADLFALGVVVREALTGRPARRLQGLAVYQALERVQREPVDVAGVPPAWHPFVAACVEPDPRLRASVPALADLLGPAPRRLVRAAAAATP
jgi:serine/threonine protein kinase